MRVAPLVPVGDGSDGPGTEDQDREWTVFLLEAYDYAVRLQVDSSDAAPA